ncbi:protein ADM2 [Antennarius striatus]|uniref:protein ADM2 n=1 Tax=Antennarius striatus TaxID=241820 RepID=UPI0035B4662C
MHFHCTMMSVLYLLLGFLPLEIHPQALTLKSLTRSHRLSSPTTSKYPKPFYTTTRPSAADLPDAIFSHVTQGHRYVIWKARTHKEPPQRSADRDDSVPWETEAWQRGSRGRRHTGIGSWRGHGHLMRVGCILGTCQVQNLSHRLYQLIGQSGREDSSPINPRSPHSYG